MSSPTSLDSLRRNRQPLLPGELLKGNELPSVIPFNRRIPSTRNLVYTYLACLFPIQVWSVYNLLREVPAWLRQMTMWDLIGVVSYAESFALFESVVIFLPFVILSALLPYRWLRDKFVALTTGIVYVSAVWFILAHVNDVTVRYWGLNQLLPWLGLFLLSEMLCFLLIHYSDKLESMITSFVARVAVLSAVYLFIDFLSLLIVVVRNV
jgi:hypothetical protein